MNNKFTKRNIIIFILFILSFLCIIYSVIMKSYHITFSGFFFLLGVLFCVFGFVKLKPLSFIKSNFLLKTIKITFRFILGCFIISVFVIEGLILSSAWEKNISKPDYIIVLGAGLWGKTPSQILQQRLDASIDIINKYPDVKVILSGGQGMEKTFQKLKL